MLAIVHMDGTKDYFTLSGKPEITFEGEQMKVQHPTAEVSFARAEISHFEFTQGLAAIDEIVADDNFTLSFVDNNLTVAGNGISVVDIFDVNGRAVKHLKATDGAVNADLNPLQAGVYVVAVKGKPAVKVVVMH